MSYRISYGQTLIKEMIKEPAINKQGKIIPALLIAGCILAVSVFASGSDGLREYILPGNAEVTEAALSELVSNVRSGEPLGEAITVFCQEIIENANIAQ